jgi:hypothetical protein
VKPEIDGAGITVNEVELAPVPPGVVTEIGPVDAPVGTVAVIWPSLSTVYVLAATPLNLTALAFVRFEPEITTLWPIGPEVGENPEIDGAGITVNDPELVAVPPGVVTEIVPVVVPFGTVAVICPALSTVNVVADVPLNLTALAFVKLDPEITTLWPIGPEVGEKPKIDGAGITVNDPELVAVPPGAVTEIVPVVAPEGTVAVI